MAGLLLASGVPLVKVNGTSPIGLGVDHDVNWVTDFSGVAGAGHEAANTSALAAFNTYYAAQTGRTRLTIPAGTYYFTDDPGWGALGGTSLLISAYGVSLPNGGVSNKGLYNDNTHHANIVTVSAGASTVTLVTAGQTSRFSVGQWVLVTGIDLQGYGYPVNPGIFEFRRILSIGTGTLTFTAPLVNSYKSTWPNYTAGTGSEIYQGGPGTVYAIDPIWDQEVMIAGAHFRDNNNLFYGKVRKIWYVDCQWDTYGPCPTVQEIFSATRCVCPTIEVDKAAQRVVFDNCDVGLIQFQSSSINELSVTNCRATTAWQGVAGGVTGISGLVTPQFRFGVTSYGVVIGATVVASATVSGLISDNYWNPGYEFLFSSYVEEGGGVLSIASASGPQAWAIPGAYAVLTNSGDIYSRAFQVTDVSVSAGKTFITTTLPFPVPSPFNGVSAPWTIYPHPGPHLTVTGSVNSVLTTMSALPADSPITLNGRAWTL